MHGFDLFLSLPTCLLLNDSVLIILLPFTEFLEPFL